ncbi:UNVERIFIED_CONTAM: hypothetical protein GTU68_050501, partial [Idotea baltica]|nr:hypothetical protein [Idotea baltica]
EITLYQVDAFSEKAFGGNPAAVCVLDKWISDDLMQNIAAEINLSETAFFVKEEDDEEAVIKTRPDFTKLARLDLRGVIITAKGNDVDFVSRCFYPALGIDEDPVTGSAHTLLMPYWSRRLNKNNLTAIQLSKRQGLLSCQLKGGRVNITAPAKTIIKGKLYL